MVQINELIMRVPGMDEGAAESMGRDVAQRVAAAVPDGLPEQWVPGLKIRMDAARYDSNSAGGRDAMAGAIADQIVQQLKMMNL
ncbi:MAG TPA: hypothetical protein VK563_16840 [Puia sp.]|nr:hypothetical protein [Puia sp.]